MIRNKYLVLFGLVIIIGALLLRQHFVINRDAALKDRFEKRTFSIFSALHPKDTDLDPSIFLDDGNEVPEKQVPPPAKDPNAISAEAYIVGNLETGEVYLSHKSENVYPIASVSKLYTSLIARHVMDPEEKILITEKALSAYGDAGHLVLNEKFSPEELLYPLVMESSNDAAEAFAEAYGYTEFIQQMNDFAQEIGMQSTSFRDASGLSPGNVSSAKDLLAFSRYLYQYEKPLLGITKTREYVLATTTDHGSHRFVSINPLTLSPNFIGGKTGRTFEAGESMVSLFEYPVGDVKYPIAIIVLRSQFSEREADTGRLLNRFLESMEGR